MDEIWDRSRGVIRKDISFRLELMGFDVRDVTLYLPLQAVWTALEEVDRRITTDAKEMEDLRQSLEGKRCAHCFSQEERCPKDATVQIIFYYPVYDPIGGLTNRCWEHYLELENRARNPDAVFKIREAKLLGEEEKSDIVKGGLW